MIITPDKATSDKDDADNQPKKYVDLFLENHECVNAILWEHPSTKGNDWMYYGFITGVYDKHDTQWVDEFFSINCANAFNEALYYDIENKWNL